MEVRKRRVKIIVLISIIVLAVLIAIGVAVNATGSDGIAKSKTFSENMDGYYVYFRAVDEAGNAGDWSNAQRIWIDTTVPTVTAKESSATIKEGDVNVLADYFTVVANGTNSDVEVVCTIGVTEYTTTETLTIGTYTVLCTATKNGGKSGSAEMELVVESAVPTPWDGTIATSFARGTGSETDPYIIETPQQLAYLSSSSNAGTSYEGVHFKQMADINLGGIQSADGTWSGPNWISIDSNGIIFDGNGYEIWNLYCVRNGYVGLFGWNNGLSLKNITIASGYVEQTGSYSSDWAGAIVYDTYSGGYFENLVNYATVKGIKNAGGVFGRTTFNDKSVVNCKNYGIIEAEYAGGIVGVANSNSSYYAEQGCENYGNLICSESEGTGLVGYVTRSDPYDDQCFVAQTKVFTPNGYQNIEDIKIGEIVYSMNLETKQLEEKAVTRLKITENGCPLTYLIYTGENYIESTPDHRYYVKDKGWIDACELELGDMLMDEGGNEKVITEIQTKVYEEPVTVYNFEVEDNRNYFVGEDKILVYTIPLNVK